MGCGSSKAAKADVPTAAPIPLGALKQPPSTDSATEAHDEAVHTPPSCPSDAGASASPAALVLAGDGGSCSDCSANATDSIGDRLTSDKAPINIGNEADEAAPISTTPSVSQPQVVPPDATHLDPPPLSSTADAIARPAREASPFSPHKAPRSSSETQFVSDAE